MISLLPHDHVPSLEPVCLSVDFRAFEKGGVFDDVQLKMFADCLNASVSTFDF